MAALFTGKVLLANRERDELDTERELQRALDNKVLLLFFGSARCPRCRRFAPLLRDFFLRLTDRFYVERAAQLGLVYVSRDDTEEQQSRFLRTMPKRWLALPFGDAFNRYRSGRSTPFPDVFPSFSAPARCLNAPPPHRFITQNHFIFLPSGFFADKVDVLIFQRTIYNPKSRPVRPRGMNGARVTDAAGRIGHTDLISAAINVEN